MPMVRIMPMAEIELREKIMPMVKIMIMLKI